jgi:PAS domain S-box-containing protein
MQLDKKNLQALLEHAPQAILIVGRDGHIVFTNAQTAKMFGYDGDELLGQPIEILIPERSREIHTGYRGHYVSDPHTRPVGSNLQLSALRKNGDEFPVEVGLRAIKVENQTLVTCYVTDLTQRQQIEEEMRQLYAGLERRARQLNALHEIGRTLAATLDLHEIYWVIFHEIALVLLDTSNLVIALFDHETQTIYCDFAIVDGEEKDPGQFPAMPLGEGPVSETIRSRQPHVVDLHNLAPQLQARGRGVQVGDERQPQTALYVPMIAGARVIGVLMMQHYEASAYDETNMLLLSTLASQAAVAITNAQLYAHEQERADALALALEKQKELDRLQTEFLQNVSHELRTPLGIVHGYAELLDSGELGELEPEFKEPINIIARRIKMLRQIVEDFTTILESETVETKPEPVYLAFLVQLLLKDFQASAQQAGLTLNVEITPDLPPILGHTNQLQRVVDNLVTNALKFTPHGGTVTLRLWQQEKNVVLEVSDTGIGIPPDQLERIFERFYQVDGSTTRRFGGTGLGLALVKEITQAHGGQVSVESTVGEGSTFRVQLPLVGVGGA